MLKIAWMRSLSPDLRIANSSVERNTLLLFILEEDCAISQLFGRIPLRGKNEAQDLSD